MKCSIIFQILLVGICSVGNVSARLCAQKTQEEKRAGILKTFFDDSADEELSSVQEQNRAIRLLRGFFAANSGAPETAKFVETWMKCPEDKEMTVYRLRPLLAKIIARIFKQTDAKFFLVFEKLRQTFMGQPTIGDVKTLFDEIASYCPDESGIGSCDCFERIAGAFELAASDDGFNLSAGTESVNDIKIIGASDASRSKPDNYLMTSEPEPATEDDNTEASQDAILADPLDPAVLKPLFDYFINLPIQHDTDIIPTQQYVNRAYINATYGHLKNFVNEMDHKKGSPPSLQLEPCAAEPEAESPTDYKQSLQKQMLYKAKSDEGFLAASGIDSAAGDLTLSALLAEHALASSALSKQQQQPKLRGARRIQNITHLLRDAEHVKLEFLNKALVSEKTETAAANRIVLANDDKNTDTTENDSNSSGDSDYVKVDEVHSDEEEFVLVDSETTDE